MDNSVEAISTTLRRLAHGTAPMGDFVSLRNGKAKANGKQEALPFPVATNGNGMHRPVIDFAILSESGATNELAAVLSEWIGQAGPGVTERIVADFPKAAMALASKDRILKKVIDAVGACELRKSRSGFAPWPGRSSDNSYRKAGRKASSGKSLAVQERRDRAAFASGSQAR